MFIIEKERNSMPVWEKILGLCVITFSLASLCAVFRESLKPEKPLEVESVSEESTIVRFPGLVTRIEWGAQPPVRQVIRDMSPSYVIISHTASNFCLTKVQCIRIVRGIQDYHIVEKNWNDIAYNFLVGGDGLIYEGRGWNVIGAHTKDHNHHSIGISFIGNFGKKRPNNRQLVAAQKLIKIGIETGKISGGYKLLGHRQLVKTESPGEILFNIIKKWDHWSPTP